MKPSRSVGLHADTPVQTFVNTKVRAPNAFAWPRSKDCTRSRESGIQFTCF